MPPYYYPRFADNVVFFCSISSSLDMSRSEHRTVTSDICLSNSTRSADVAAYETISINYIEPYLRECRHINNTPNKQAVRKGVDTQRSTFAIQRHIVYKNMFVPESVVLANPRFSRIDAPTARTATFSPPDLRCFCR